MQIVDVFFIVDIMYTVLVEGGGLVQVTRSRR